MRTIKDVFKKVDEMKIPRDKAHSFAYNIALEEVKPIIEKEIKEILGELEKRIQDTKEMIEVEGIKYEEGYKRRDQELREDIEKITK